VIEPATDCFSDRARLISYNLLRRRISDDPAVTVFNLLEAITCGLW